MTFTANYAMSRYAASVYGVRGPAGYTTSTGDAVTGGDGLGAAAACNPLTSDSTTGSDNLAAIASCIPATLDAVAGNDGIAAGALCNPVTADSITSSDFLSVLAGFYDACTGAVIALDGSIFQYLRPVNVFALEKEKRIAELFDEVRELIALARKQAAARRENRQGSSTEKRSTNVKSDSREFET